MKCKIVLVSNDGVETTVDEVPLPGDQPTYLAWRSALRTRFATGAADTVVNTLLQNRRLLAARLKEMVEVYLRLEAELSKGLSYATLLRLRTYVRGMAIPDAQAALAEAEVLTQEAGEQDEARPVWEKIYDKR